MAVGTVWSFGDFKVDVTFNQRINATIENLDNGGYVVSLQGPVSTLLLFIDKNGNSSTAVLNGATKADVTQRADGNVSVVYEKGGETFTHSAALNGASVVAETAAGGPGSSEPSVSECEGIALRVASIFGDGDIYFKYKIDATTYSALTAVTTVAANDIAPQITCLEGGGYAIVWYRVDHDAYLQPWRAVYNGDGTIRHAPEEFGDVRETPNSKLDLIATDDRRFIVRYEGYKPVIHTYDLLSERFDANGNQTIGTSTADGHNERGVAVDSSTPRRRRPSPSSCPEETFALVCTSEESGSPGLDIQAGPDRCGNRPVGHRRPADGPHRRRHRKSTSTSRRSERPAARALP